MSHGVNCRTLAVNGRTHHVAAWRLKRAPNPNSLSSPSSPLLQQLLRPALVSAVCGDGDDDGEDFPFADLYREAFPDDVCSDEMEVPDVSDEDWSDVEDAPAIEVCSLSPSAVVVDPFWQEVCKSEVTYDDIPADRPLADLKVRAGARPVFRSPFPTPARYEDAEKMVLEDLQRQGKIRPAPPGHSNSPFFLKFEEKSDGSIRARPLVDLSHLADVFETRQWPLPDLKGVLNKVAAARHYTVLDLSQGFHQIRVPPEAAPYLAFTASGRRWEWLVLPFGLPQSPTLFMNYLREVFEDQISEGWLQIYVDDLVVMASTPDELLERCNVVKQILRANHLWINPRKVQHNQQQVVLLGHSVSHGEIKPLEGYVTKVRAFRPPRTAHQHRVFRGALAWLSKYIPNLQPKIKEYEDSPTPEGFATLMGQLDGMVTLAPFDVSRPLELYTDACDTGWGGVLRQGEQVLQCVSGQWGTSERRWHVREKEFAAVLRSLRALSWYCTGTPVTVFTDHKPNISLKVTRKLNTQKVLGWLAEAAQWDIRWKHIPGRCNGLADWLSRGWEDSEVLQQMERDRAGVAELGGGSKAQFQGTCFTKNVATLITETPATVSSANPLFSTSHRHHHREPPAPSRPKNKDSRPKEDPDRHAGFTTDTWFRPWLRSIYTYGY